MELKTIFEAIWSVFAWIVGGISNLLALGSLTALIVWGTIIILLIKR